MRHLRNFGKSSVLSHYSKCHVIRWQQVHQSLTATQLLQSPRQFGWQRAHQGCLRAVALSFVGFRFVRAYNPIAATKASAAAIVLRETFRHLLETST